MSKGLFYLCGGWCPRRKLDAQTICNYLKANNWKSTSKPKNADLLIVYTCGGFDINETGSVNSIKDCLKKKRKNAKLIVTGCLTKINPDVLKFDDTTFISLDNLSELDNIIDAEISIKDIPNANIVHKIPELLIPKIDNKMKKFIRRFELNKEFIKKCQRSLKSMFKEDRYDLTKDKFSIMVSRGCLGKCSYCAIKKAHGDVRSKPIKTIISELESGLKKYKNIFLVSEDTGCYGMDNGLSIVDLLTEIFNHNEDFKLTIEDFNPQWMIKYYDKLMPLLKKNISRMDSIIMPIQSGSNNTLQAMRRPYNIDQVKSCFKSLKKEIPELEIGTHLIIGFPGETDEDFKGSKKLLQEIKFSRVILYTYSARKGTDASLMENKVDPETIQKRYDEISILT